MLIFAVKIPKILWFICLVQREWSEKKKQMIFSNKSSNNFIYAKSLSFSLRTWSRLKASVCVCVCVRHAFMILISIFRKVFQEENVRPFNVILPVVNAIYYFPERRTCRAGSYWQVNCRVHQHSFLFLCFRSTHLLELSEVLCIMRLVWYATSWNMFEMALRRPFSGESVFTFARMTGFNKFKGYIFYPIACRDPCREVNGWKMSLYLFNGRLQCYHSVNVSIHIQI